MATSPGVGVTMQAFRVGGWLVEPDTNRLSRGDVERQLEPKTMEVLVYLAQRQGDVVSGDELIKAVWNDRPMGDNPVYKSIAKLRAVIDDGTKGESLILTVPKRGYKLLGTAAADANTVAPATTPRKLHPFFAPLAIGVVIGLAFAAAVLWQPAAPPASFMPVSTFAGSHSQPSFAPDGERFAFVNDVDGVPHIWLSGSEEFAPAQLTFGSAPSARPRWSPTGDRILFTRGGSVWTISAAGGEPEEVLREASNPNWSRDGERIVFERRYGVWIADADGSGQTNLSAIPQAELALAPRWPAFGPDGNRIVFFETSESPEGDLWTLDLRTNRLQQLTNAPAFGGAPVWSPDGSQILYSSQRGGSRTLWSVDPREQTSRALLVGSGDDDFPDVSADGERVIYSNSRERFVLLQKDPESGAERVLHESRLALIGPELSPDGSTIALFGPAASGGVQLVTLPLTGGAVRSVTSDPTAVHALPRWAPGGNSLYFFHTTSSPAYGKVATAGGDVERVAAGWNWSIANGASIDPSGRRIMYSRLDGQAPIQTLIRNLDSARDESFFATLEYPRWSADGERVVGSLFTDQHFPGDVAICSVSEEDCHTIAERARIPMWSSDELRVFFVRGFGTSQELFVVNADGSGEERKLFDMAPLLPLGPFYSVTQNDQIVWIRHEKDPGAIWVIDNQND